jgi:hypothetical protein
LIEVTRVQFHPAQFCWRATIETFHGGGACDPTATNTRQKLIVPGVVTGDAGWRSHETCDIAGWLSYA